MGLEVRAADDQSVVLACLAGQRGEDAAEQPHVAPANEAIVEGHVGVVARRGTAPAQAALDNEDDPTEDTPVIHPRHPVREREVRPDAPHLGGAELERDGH